jgi:hypothetical protein
LIDVALGGLERLGVAFCDVLLAVEVIVEIAFLLGNVHVRIIQDLINI